MATPTMLDTAELVRQIKALYRQVAQQPAAAFHFPLGRPLAERLGYPAELLDAVPAEALASFAGVGYALDLAGLTRARGCWTWAAGRAPTRSPPRTWSGRPGRSPVST
jgi:hypothetical protein